MSKGCAIRMGGRASELQSCVVCQVSYHLESRSRFVQVCTRTEIETVNGLFESHFSLAGKGICSSHRIRETLEERRDGGVV